MALKERIAASVLIASLTFGGVGCQDINATKPTTTITEPSVPSETTPTTRPTTEATTTPTTKPTIETTPTPTTTETKSELDGIPAERLQFVEDLIKIHENSLLTSTHKAFNKVDDYITREQIINYGKTGEYGDIENFSIINYKDGKPAIAMINCQENVVSGFKKAIKLMERYDPNFLKIITDNGMRSFIVNRFDDKIGFVYTFNKEGQFVWNISKEGLKTEVPYMDTLLRESLYTESIGIKMLNLGVEYTEHIGFYKQKLSAYSWWNEYCESNDKDCKNLSYSNYLFGKTFYGERYSPISINSEIIQNTVNKIFDENLIAFFGGTAEEINKNRKTMPDWNLGDLN